MTRDLRNPFASVDCPDPCLVATDDGHLLTGTTFHNTDPAKFPLFRTRDLVSFERIGHVFPPGRGPTWAKDDFWAPEIHRVGKKWHCWFTARDTTGRLCVGVATADRPEGPWHDTGAPFLRDERVGLIDAHRFVDTDGRAYLFWKRDGNDLSPKEPTPIFVQELSEDGLSLVGERTVAITNDLPWEGDVVEGPWVVRRGEHLYMFYSGHAYFTADYGTGVARARSVTGPWEKLDGSILSSGERWRGPGHGCVVRIEGEDHFVYHAWDRDKIFGDHPRIPIVGRIRWRAGWPTIEPAADRDAESDAAAAE